MSKFLSRAFRKSDSNWFLCKLCVSPARGLRTAWRTGPRHRTTQARISANSTDQSSLRFEAWGRLQSRPLLQ
jgi:hypothetical protein